MFSNANPGGKKCLTPYPSRSNFCSGNYCCSFLARYKGGSLPRKDMQKSILLPGLEGLSCIGVVQLDTDRWMLHGRRYEETIGDVQYAFVGASAHDFSMTRGSRLLQGESGACNLCFIGDVTTHDLLCDVMGGVFSCKAFAVG